jgi:hypothetical protein
VIRRLTLLHRTSRGGTDVDAPASRTSSIFLRRMIGSMFMRVNPKGAHQVRPPSDPTVRVWCRTGVGSQPRAPPSKPRGNVSTVAAVSY